MIPDHVITHHLMALAKAKEPFATSWMVEVKSEWEKHAVSWTKELWSCRVCFDRFLDVDEHKRKHMPDVERMLREDLVPFTGAMNYTLQQAHLGDGDEVVHISSVPCISRKFAALIDSPISSKHLRWAFNRLWHDDDGFGDAVLAARRIPGGVVKFIEQQYRSDDDA